MIKEVSMFEAGGKKFATKFEAIAHLRSDEFAGTADDYIEAMGYEGRVATRVANEIKKFLAWDAVISE